VTEAPASPRGTVLYVMGQDRSGSTVLGDVLGQAAGVAHLGEIRNLWRAGLLREGICGCGRPVRECELWSVAAPKALGDADPAAVVGWLGASLRLRHLPGYLRAAAAKDLNVQEARSVADLSARLYEALFGLTGARVIVDTSKHPVYAAILATVPGLDLRFVHLVRDPRATAFSWSREKASPGRPGNRMWRAPAWRAGRAWVLANGAADRVRTRYPDRSMLLRYEDAMARPREAIAGMLRLAGERSEPPVDARGAATLAPQHTAAGNPVRLADGPVELREDDAWRKGQRPRDRLVVMALTAPFLRRYGYPLRPGDRR
jgi:hypothetical protein